MSDNTINICMTGRHAIPDGYSIMKDMHDGFYYFKRSNNIYGPYSTRFKARTAVIEHNKSINEGNISVLSESVAKFIGLIK